MDHVQNLYKGQINWLMEPVRKDLRLKIKWISLTIPLTCTMFAQRWVRLILLLLFHRNARSHRLSCLAPFSTTLNRERENHLCFCWRRSLYPGHLNWKQACYPLLNCHLASFFLIKNTLQSKINQLLIRKTYKLVNFNEPVSIKEKKSKRKLSGLTNLHFRHFSRV